ncbi:MULTISPECIES: hypothetical protein [unclassified Mesorhizobium]|uniref:hypothetical protein n=1 Tax=unclassified Mesorhizobium TaxID=325217 RepID=UPI0003CFE807|nr:hypothetical protein X735_20455 [Mesorhizobium sp. L2C085B000]
MPLDSNNSLIFRFDCSVRAAVMAGPEPSACGWAVHRLHDAADLFLLERCGEIEGRRLPSYDGPRPCQPNASTSAEHELERLVLFLERLEDRASVEDLKAALIGEADGRAICCWHGSDIAFNLPREILQ